MHRIHFLTLVIYLLVLWSMETTAQDERRRLLKLGPDDLSTEVFSGSDEIVSASRTIKKVEEIPVTVHIISRREILENGYFTLVDALKTVPGIRVSQPGSAMEGETFMIRGLHGNYYCKACIK